MKRLKLLFGLILSISIVTGYISYVTQIVYYFYFSALLIVFYLAIVFLSRARRENGRFFRFIKGDFCLKGDIGARRTVKTRRFHDLLKEPYSYSVIGVLLLFIILQIQTRTVILTGLSIISAAAALSILSFNYFNALRGDSNQNIILASAKRYFLTTLYGVIMLMVLISIKYLPALPNVLTQVPVEFVALYFNIFIYALLIVVFIFLISTTLRFLTEGIYLSLKGTIKFDNS